MKSKIKITVSLLLFTASVMAQVVNTGVMHVNPNTIVSIVPDFDNQASGSLLNDGDAYIYANFNNDGIVNFTPAQNGYTRFQGFLNQKLTGSKQSDFQHLLFNNANPQPAFSLYSKISVAGNADFFKGILKDDDFGGLMIFEKAATHTNVDNDSHVDGKVQRNGALAFKYPIGDENLYRYAAIGATSEALSSFTGKYFYENADPLYPLASKAGIIDLINNQEYWTLDKTAGTADAILTLSWDESTTTPANIVANPQTAIHIVRWDATQKLWVDEGGIVDSATKTVTTPISVSGYNVFTTARIDESKIITPCNKLVVYNIVTPNGDGQNDYFRIDGLADCSVNNTLEIYNRWGIKVYEAVNYGVNNTVFKGFSEGRVTIESKDLLPVGTYYYILTLKAANAKVQDVKKAGYLYINK